MLQKKKRKNFKLLNLNKRLNNNKISYIVCLYETTRRQDKTSQDLPRNSVCNRKNLNVVYLRLQETGYDVIKHEENNGII